MNETTKDAAVQAEEELREDAVTEAASERTVRSPREAMRRHKAA